MISNRKMVTRMSAAGFTVLTLLTACESGSAAVRAAHTVTPPRVAAARAVPEAAIAKLIAARADHGHVRAGAFARASNVRQVSERPRAVHASAASGGEGRVADVTGSWQEIGVACGPGTIEANIYKGHCTGFAIAEGGWIGVFREELDANINLVTGDMWGTSTQEFTGRSTDGSTGTIAMTEDFTVDGASGSLHGVATITGGTGDFTGSSGQYEAYGIALTGGYSAHWIRP